MGRRPGLALAPETNALDRSRIRRSNAGLVLPEGTVVILVLSGLLTHPYIKLLCYRDEGPFADAPRRSYGPPEAGLIAAEGWAELLPPDGKDGRDLLYTDLSGPVYTGVLGMRAGYARSEIASAVYTDLDPGAAADRRERDALAAEVAEAVQAEPVYHRAALPLRDAGSDGTGSDSVQASGSPRPRGALPPLSE